MPRWLAAAAAACCAAALPLAASAQVALSSASAVVGQSSSTMSGANQSLNGGANPYGFGVPGSEGGGPGPWGVWSDGHKLIVADEGASRVLIYNALPSASAAAADVVVGEPDLYTDNDSAATAKDLEDPHGVFSDGTRLFVADGASQRVLIYNSIPSANYTAADLVLTTASGLATPYAVWSDGTRLIVGETTGGSSGDVLIYNTIPASDGTAPDVRLTNESASAFGQITGLYSAGGKLFLADATNNRVLIYNAIPSSDGTAANVVLTQDAASNPLSSPTGVWSDGTRLAVAQDEQDAASVWLYASIPAADAAAPAAELGTGPGANSQGCDVGFVAPPNEFCNPVGVFSDGTRLYVAESDSNRVDVFPALPGSSSALPGFEVGQPNTNYTGAQFGDFSSGVAGDVLQAPRGGWSDGTRLFVADTQNNRVLIYNPIPSSYNAFASTAIGAADLNGSIGNASGGIALSSGVISPAAVCAVGSRLFVADTGNNRVLFFNAIPSTFAVSADGVLGQANFSAASGGSGAAAMSGPAGLWCDSSHLYVADKNNNRVLIFDNAAALATDAAANVILGQAGAGVSTCNTGGRSAATLCGPNALWSDGSVLYVADQTNNRVLIFQNVSSLATGAPASVAIGQSLMTTASAPSPPTASSLNGPTGVYYDGARLIVVDSVDNRALVYDAVPASNGAAADAVIGQADFASQTANRGFGAPDVDTLSGPGLVWGDASRLYIADTNNNRVLVFPDSGAATASATITPAGGTVTLNAPSGPVTLTIPAGAFSQTGAVALSVPASFPGNASDSASLSGTGVGFQITTSLPQPVQSVGISLSYASASLPAGANPSEMLLARYDDADQTWVPLPTTIQTASKLALSSTGHFSLFQLMQSSPASSAGSARAFPNPLFPGRGQAGMTFSNLPAGETLRIYSILGQRIRELTADGTGTAFWDATNSAGAGVASGVYFVLLEGSGAHRTMKVIVQR